MKKCPKKNKDLKNLSIGERLKFLRSINGLSRKKLTDKYGLSVASLDSWERNIAPPSKTSLKKIISIYSNEGTIVSENWIMTGLGKPPTALYISIESKSSEIDLNKSAIINDSNKGSFIQKEIRFFENLYKNSITLQVINDEMRPFYEPGDTIGGILKFANEIDDCSGKDCIVLLDNNVKIFRRVVKNIENGKYNLVCLNPLLSKTPEPVMYNMQINASAPVIWIRK